MSAPLQRVHNGRMIAGVCAGIARQLNMDPTPVRLVAVACGVVFFSFALPVYGIAWLALPDDVTGTTGLEDLIKRFGNSGPGTSGPTDSYRSDS